MDERGAISAGDRRLPRDRRATGCTRGRRAASARRSRALEGETISRELGVVAPAEARAAWTEHGLATFTYGDGVGRVRATSPAITVGRVHRCACSSASHRRSTGSASGARLAAGSTRGARARGRPDGHRQDDDARGTRARARRQAQTGRHSRRSDRDHARDQSVGEPTRTGTYPVSQPA